MVNKRLKLVQIHDKLRDINLLGENNTPVKFVAFKNATTIMKYGTGKRTKKIVFAGKPKENLFGFYVIHDTDSNVLKEAYEIYKRMLKGDREVFDEFSVIWGNSGLPITYGYIYIRGNSVI